MSPAVLFSLAVLARLTDLESRWTVVIVVGDVNIHAAKLLLRAGEIHGLIGISNSSAGPIVERETRVDGLRELLDVAVDAAANDLGRMPRDLAARGAA